MKNGAEMNYDFGMKANWRRTIHNRIVDLLPVKPKDAVVLYLAGKQDLDRVEFRRRGFKDHNLIAVEKNSAVSRELRTDGRLCLNADMLEIIKQWRRSKVHVVVGDFCCGLELSVTEAISWLMYNPCFNKAVCVFNMMRGRDPRSNQIRRLFDGGGSVKHRGKILTRFYVAKLLSRINRIVNVKGKETDDAFDTTCNDRLRDMIRKLGDSGIPCWHDSYMSDSGQRFDSCVFSNVTVEGLTDDSIRSSFVDTVRSNTQQMVLQMHAEEMEKHRIENLLNPRICDKFEKIMEGNLDGMLREVLQKLNPEGEAAARGGIVESRIGKLAADMSNPVARQIAAIKATRTRYITNELP